MTSVAEPSGGPGVLFAFMRPTVANRVDFHDWYPEHVASRLRVPGFLAASLFVDGNPAEQRVTVYHLDSTEVLAGPAYLAVRAETQGETEPRIGSLEEFVRVVGIGAVTADPLLPDVAGLAAIGVAPGDSGDALSASELDGLVEGSDAVVLQVSSVGSNIDASHLLLLDSRSLDALQDRLSVSRLRAVWSGTVQAPETIQTPDTRGL